MSPLLSGTKPAVLRIKTAADYLGVSRAFLYQLFSRGELQRIKLGGRAAGVIRADLDAWIADQSTSRAVPARRRSRETLKVGAMRPKPMR